MKTLFMAFALLTVGVACNKSPSTDYNQKQEEAKQDYREEVNEAAKDRNEEIKDARKDLQEAQKEEAQEYVEESDGASVDKSQQRINVNEAEDQD